jgi:hypothetical protein
VEAVQLIQSIEQVGCFLQAEGENVLIFNSNRLSFFLKDQLKNNKSDVIELLTFDKKAKEAGFIVGLPGELYTQSINSSSAVYIERIESEWQIWQETYQDHRKSVWYKVISKSEDFHDVLASAVRYLDYLRKKGGFNGE